MKILSRFSLGSKRQAILFGSLAVILLLALVRWRPGGSAPSAAPGPPSAAGDAAPPARGASLEDEPGAPPRASASTSASRRGPARAVSADDVPPLSKKDFDPPSGRGPADSQRDLFSLEEPTRVPPPTPTPRPPMPGEGMFVGPLPPPPPTPTPKPPEVTFKFLGSFGPKDQPIAVIQQGDEVFNARAGDTLFGKFVLKKVGYESVDIGFIGFAESETKRLAISQ